MLLLKADALIVNTNQNITVAYSTSGGQPIVEYTHTSGWLVIDLSV